VRPHGRVGHDRRRVRRRVRPPVDDRRRAVAATGGEVDAAAGLEPVELLRDGELIYDGAADAADVLSLVKS
jgi:hypothetical protein